MQGLRDIKGVEKMIEKINFKNSKGLKLVGVLHIPEKKTDCAIIVSPGFASSKDRPRFIQLSEMLCDQGFTVLRFDFGGYGESEEREITVKGQVDDLKSAINYLRGQDYGPFGLVGHSFGGLTSVLAYEKQVKVIVLWAPVTKAKIPGSLKNQDYEKELKEKGYIIYRKEGREYKLPKEYIEERQSVNQQAILSKLKCPVMIIHGDEDDSVPLQHSEEAMQYLTKESKLEVIKKGSHNLDESLDQVMALSAKWLKKYLKAYI
jgi:alpha/beta superfamily hydrolase